MRIIPAIDIIDGKCVRLSQGDYNTQKVYSENPLEMAKSFEDIGVKYLHLVDLDGAKAQHIINYKTLEAICEKTSLKVDFGGGLKSDEDLRIAFESGASQITGGSVAAKNPSIFLGWLEQYGSEKIILGADFNQRKVSTNGWKEKSKIDVLEFIRNYEKEGIKYVISTDISKDGMLGGPAFALYEEIIKETNVHLIASGGVSNIQDLHRLKALGCEGAIVGKAIYERKISINELEKLC
jgi:phosphoribosylformimino-5-aminoimidazole carboxamide ribotide isomerase